jgi:hypothetical protein
MKIKHLTTGMWCVTARWGASFALMVVVLGTLLAPGVRAATYDVSNTNDSGGGSLRQAITDANNNPGADTITFSTSGIIPLGSDLPPIDDDVTITGPGANQLTIDGAGSYQPFDINAGNTVTITGVTITSGNGGTDGGAIFNEGALTIDGCTVRDSQAQNGGGISNWTGATLNVYNSTISENIATTWGGGIANYGDMTISHTTVTANTCTGTYGAGGIGQYSAGASSTVVHSTIVLNGATQDSTESGLFIEAGTATVVNSIVSHNGSGGSTTDNFKTEGSGSITSLGYNVSNEFNAVAMTTGDLEADPMINTLADNGGGTWTHGLRAVSGGAVDRIPSGTSGCGTIHTTDQRGQLRPVDRADVSGTGCDAGAFELQIGEAPNAVTLRGLAVRAPLPVLMLAVGLIGALGGAAFLRLRRSR